LVPQRGTFQPVCIALAWKLNRIDQFVIYDHFLWHMLQSVCTIAMAAKELFIHPATSPHPGLPLETKADLIQNGKESYLALRKLEVKCHIFLFCLLHSIILG